MLPREDDELLDVEPVEAADELLARMLEAERYRSAAEHLRGLLEGEEGVRYRVAPPPAWLRKATEMEDLGPGVYKPDRLGAALGGAAAPPAARRRHPPRPGPRQRQRAPRPPARPAAPRALHASTRPSAGADRVTVCITLFALLEMYKQGEATWTQERAVRRDRRVAPGARPRGARARPRRRPPTSRRRARARRAVERGCAPRSSRRCCSSRPSPVSLEDLAEACEVGVEDVDWALGELREAFAARPRPRAARRSPAAGRSRPTRSPSPPRAGCWPSRARRRSARRRPRRWRSSPTSSRSRGPRSRGSAASRQRQRDGDAARARPDRGVRPLAVRRGALPHDAAVPQALRPRARSTTLPDPSQWDPTPEEQGELRDRLLRAGEARAGLAAGDDRARAEPSRRPLGLEPADGRGDPRRGDLGRLLVPLLARPARPAARGPTSGMLLAGRPPRRRRPPRSRAPRRRGRTGTPGRAARKTRLSGSRERVAVDAARRGRSRRSGSARSSGRRSRR